MDAFDKLVLRLFEVIFELCDLLKHLSLESALSEFKLLKHHIELTARISYVADIQVCLDCLSFCSLVNRVVAHSNSCLLKRLVSDYLLNQLLQIVYARVSLRDEKRTATMFTIFQVFIESFVIKIFTLKSGLLRFNDFLFLFFRKSFSFLYQLGSLLPQLFVKRTPTSALSPRTNRVWCEASRVALVLPVAVRA